MQAQGPLKVKLNRSLKKLYHEGEVIKELLNIAAESADSMPRMEQCELHCTCIGGRSSNSTCFVLYIVICVVYKTPLSNYVFIQ